MELENRQGSLGDELRVLQLGPAVGHRRQPGLRRRHQGSSFPGLPRRRSIRARAAFHGETGEILWQFRTNSGITAVPSSYSVNGTQYIAVQAGWGVDAVRMEGSLNAERGWDGDMRPTPIGGVLWVFKLD